MARKEAREMIKTSATGEISNSSCDARKKIRASMGFTLLELMIVLTIMTLLVAATPAALNRVLPAYRLRTAAEQLLADLRMARVQAQAQGRVFVVACKESAYVVQSQGDASQRTVSLSSKTIL